MQHEMMRHPAPTPGSENVGDVLASIRRLISQDDSGCRIPDQALNALPNPDDTARIRIEPTLSPVPPQAPRIDPLVLDSTAMVVDRADPVEPAPVKDGLTTAQTTPSQPSVFDAAYDGDWADSPAIGPFSSLFGERKAPADRALANPSPAAAQEQTATTADPAPARDMPYPTTNVQMEETMLHANASVTPINPAAEAQATPEATSHESEPHLFAPQDKSAQKGMHLRGMIREAIRQELQGEIGNRLSRNLQQMIRHEIELTLRQMCEQE